MKTLVDVVILSKCTNKQYFDLNTNCLHSLTESEEDTHFNILLVENNHFFEQMGFKYDLPNVTVIIPNEPFNFNRYLNIGLAQTQQKWIVFANNDLVFYKGWLSEIFKVKEQNPAIQSFCPFDHSSKYLSFEKFKPKSYYMGYRVPIEFVGWCFVTERRIFEQIGKFDEQFDLYFQDNDFALTLKKHSILHAMVPASFVKHIAGYTTGNADASHTVKYQEDKIRFLNKWHRPYITRLKNKLIDLLKFWDS